MSTALQRNRGWAAASGLCALALLLPLIPGFSGQSSVGVITSIAVAAYLALSWNVLGGLAGQLAFGNAVFFGAGAYGTAVFFIHYGWNPLIGGLIGILVAVVLGLAIGYVGFRYSLSHLGFALATAAFSLVALFFVKGIDYLGGAFGLVLPVHAGAGQLYFTDGRIYYWIFAALVILAMLFTWRLRRGRLGTYFVAIREDEQAAEASGINVMKTKLIAIAISAAMTGLGGVFYAHYLRFLSPESIFSFEQSLQIVIPAMLGGTTMLAGPVVGAIAYGLILEKTKGILDFAGGPEILLGAVLGAVVLYMPRGILPTLTDLYLRLRHRHADGGAAGPSPPSHDWGQPFGTRADEREPIPAAARVEGERTSPA